MARKKGKIHHEEEAGEAWLLPYSDLMTLLLAVFIVLFAVSQVDEQKAVMMSDEFSGTMMTESYTQQRIDAKNQAMAENGGDSDSAGEGDEIKELEELKARLDAKLKEENMLDHVETYIDKRGLVISMHNAIIFDSGKAEIKREFENAMLEIAEIINSTNNYIRIEGHTDNIPMNSDIYPSNWELSSARAISVVRLFVDKTKASPDKILAVGYGEYRPVSDNGTEVGRAKNRRIDIIILNEESKSMEVNI
jgi:chemotaxis protein MotB